MSIATGRDPQALELLYSQPPSVTIVIPGICFMEALVALETERKNRKEFQERLRLQINEARRNLSSADIKSLIHHLEQAAFDYNRLLNEVETRFNQAFAQLSTQAQIVHLSPEILQNHLSPILEKSPQDNLILCCIQYHASKHPEVVKVLLTGNSKEFSQPQVQYSLSQVGVIKYFAQVQDFLDWIQHRK